MSADLLHTLSTLTGLSYCLISPETGTARFCPNFVRQYRNLLPEAALHAELAAYCATPAAEPLQAQWPHCYLGYFPANTQAAFLQLLSQLNQLKQEQQTTAEVEEAEVLPPTFQQALWLTRHDGSRQWVNVQGQTYGGDYLLAFTPQAAPPPAVIGHVAETLAERDSTPATTVLGQIVERCPLPIFVLDAHGYVTHWNRACETILQIPASEVLGTQEQWRPFYREARPVLADLVLQGDLNSLHLLYPGKAQASTWSEDGIEVIDYFPNLNRWLQMTATPIRNSAGKVVGVIQTLIDVTANKSAENTLTEARQLAESAVRLKSEFLANMSHEIRTPLNAVISLTRLLRSTALDSRQREYSDKILSASSILLALLNDVLDLSKIEAGQLQLEQKEFSLDEVLENVATVVQNMAQEKGLELAFLVDPDMPKLLRGDSLRLTQILVNLFSNAVKFTNKGHVLGRFRVLTRNEPKTDSAASLVQLMVEVEDTGIGLTLQQQERLFQAFSQADTSTTRKYGGTGLGLIICRRLIEMMQGTIWVHSTYGEGSSFMFTANMEALTPLPSPQTNIANGKRVLLLDSHSLTGEAIQRYLGLLNYEYLWIDNLAAAHELLRAPSQEFAFIILNQSLVGSATALHQCIPELRQLSQETTRLLVLSDEPVTNLEDSLRVLGVSAILSKPLTLTHLASTLTMLGTATAAAQHGLGLTQPLRGLQILVVDDISDNRFIATELLQALGAAKVESCSSGSAALEKIGNTDRHYDVVLMDVQMPDLDGINTTRQIKSHPALADLPIIAMTAHTRDEEVRRCHEAGMVDFMQKPIELAILRRVVQRWGYSETGKPRQEILRGRKAVAPLPSVNQQAAGSAVDIPLLPGIEVEEGLRRLMYRPALYRRVLQDFYERFCQEDQRIGQAINAGDFASAIYLAHSIKGLAGTVGAVTLQHAAKELEDSLRAEDAQIQTTLADFSCALQQVLHSLRQGNVVLAT